MKVASRCPFLASTTVLTLAALACSACGGGSASSGPAPDAESPGLDAGSGVGDDAPSNLSDGGAGDDAGGGPAEASTDAPSCALTPVEPPADGGGCNQVLATGAVVQEACSDAGAPTPHGGTLVDGTYVLESATYYGVCPSPADVTRDQVTWIVCGPDWQSQRIVGAMSSSFDVTVGPGDGGAASIVLSEVCPHTVSFGWQYDATPGHLAFYIPIGTSTLAVDSYVLQ